MRSSAVESTVASLMLCLAASASAQSSFPGNGGAEGPRIALDGREVGPREGKAAEPPAPHADYWLPAAEIVGFQVVLNRFNRYFGESRDDYRVTWNSIGRNLTSSWDTDRDPFKTNQLGHPYQGAIYYGFARSTGFGYWQSSAYTFAGSIAWELFGERTRPSYNDQVASGIGGTFLGEALFRMSSLVLEKGGGLPYVWRELVATAIAPSAGLNRLAFGNRYGGIFSSKDAAYYSRLQLGYNGSVERNIGRTNTNFKQNEAQVDFALDYGLPGQKGYEYTRPFDYFNFQATLGSANGIENVITRGLLLGDSYEAGPDYRGVWGLYGSYDYLRPQTFRISTTALSIGSTAQWWLGPDISVQGTATFGLGFAAVSTARGISDERDYNYGVAPQSLIALRMTYGDKFSLDLTGREYFVSNVASGTNGGRDNIIRTEAAFTYRLRKSQAVTLKMLANRRDARFAASSQPRQSDVSVGLFYTLIGQDRFGTVDWR